MKKTIPFLFWAIFAFTTMSCTSNDSDNTPQETNEKTLLTSYILQEASSDNVSIYSANFIYDKYNRVEKHTLKYEIIEDNNRELINTTTYNYIYNDQKRLVSVQKTNDRNNSVLVFEYDNKQQMTKLSNTSENYEITFLHNENKQINEAIIPSSSTKKKTQFTYDSEGNLSRVSTSDNPNLSEVYTYDNNKNPFKDLPINIQLDLSGTLAMDIIYYYVPTNNIATYKLNGRKTGKIQYEYNNEKYPISSKRELDDRVITETFTYKKIKE